MMYLTLVVPMFKDAWDEREANDIIDSRFPFQCLVEFGGDHIKTG